MNMKKLLQLAVFLLISVGGGLLVAVNNIPDEWYYSLQKSSLTPPPWVFPPVWTTLYVMIGVAGYRAFRKRKETSLLRAWYIQMILNLCWSPLFFTAHQIVPAFILLLAIVASVVGFMKIAGKRDAVSFALFVPYLIWVSFASYLNGVIAYLN